MPEGWEWDETLYHGSAPYYERGRLPYAPGFAEALAQHLSLDGHGRLIDVGCGPGIATLPLARFFDEAVGVDPDEEMLAEAERRGRRDGVSNVRWVRARAEDLPAGLGTFRVALFAQSFHWTQREQVAAVIFQMLEPCGAFVHMSDVKQTRAADGELPHPSPPYSGVRDLLRGYLGSVRRAGQGRLPQGTPAGEAEVLAGAGFEGPARLRVAAGEVVVRTVDDLVAWVYSRSDSAPHLFGERRGEFEARLRRLLLDASPTGLFAERVPDTEMLVWRKPVPEPADRAVSPA
jgi:SAM-dependent methyltransferase